MVFKFWITFLVLFKVEALGSTDMSSSLGQEFYLGFMQNIGGGQFSSLRLLIGTDTQFASYVVETVDQIVQQGSVSSGTPVSVHISGLDLEVFTSNYDNRWKGIRVASNEDIFVVAENFILAINHGVFLAYPRFTFEQEVDYEYYIVSIEDITDFAHSQLLLVGCENETTITILPSQNVILPTNLQESSTSILVNAGTTSHTMVLNQLQTLLVSSFDDLTGTKIVSDKPLTVIGGHECAVNPASSSACEPLAVQIPSSLLWGRQFLLAPFTGRGSEQYFKLFSSIPTTVNYTCGNSSFSFNNVTNRIFGTYEYCYLESINPLLVAQVSTGSSIDFSGDLAIALISPIDNYVRETSFVSLPSYLFSLNYISVTVAIENFNSSCIMFDDQVIDCDWNEILNTEMQVVGYGCSKAVNSGSTVGTQHTVYHDNGTLSVLVYGFNGGPSLGYAYLTGQTLTEKQVTPISPPENVTAIVSSSTEICVTWAEVPVIGRIGVITSYEVMYEPLMTLDGQLVSVSLDTTGFFLSLNSLQEYIEYNISVRAYTSVGPGPYSLGIVRRTLEDVPYSSPRNVDAISTSSTVIHVSWIKVNEIDQNGVITMYEVVYLGEFDLTNRSVFTLDGDTVTVNITGVEEFAEYNISVRAYTSVGPGPYSQVQTDLTMEDVPVSPPQNIRTTALSSTEIEISWDKIPEIDQNGVISMYEVMYVMTFGGLITTRTIITIDLTLTINLSNLEEFVEYNISVRAYTSIGSGPYSVWTVRRTLEDVPSSAPRNILVSAVEPSSLYVSWERPLEIDVNGILTNYTIEHRTLNHTGDPLVVPSTTLNVLLEGLRFFTVYNVSISANTAVGKGPSVQMSQRTLVRTCPQDSSSGFLWASITEGSVLSLPCTQASSQFRPGTYATRMCLLGGTWSEVDLTSCTLDSMDSNPFMLVYLDLQEPSRRKKRSIENLLLEPMELRRKVRAATSNNSQLLLMELETIFSSLNITTEAIRVLHLAQTAEGLSIAFEIVLPKESESLPPVFVDYFNNEIQTNGLAGYSVSSGGLSGIIGVGPTETCECGTTAGGNTSIITSLQLCTGLSLSPCSCETGGCECQEPYVGDGRHCTLDSDGDLFPDVALNISSCTEENSYCVQDVCPSVSNVNQDPSDCTSTMDPGFDGCPFEEDPVWSIEWPNTERNTISTQRCPGDLDNVIGNATRLCDDNGVWLSTIVETCEDERFVEVVNQAEELFSSDANMTELVEEAIVITQTLVIITDQTSILLPSSLSSTTTIVTNILDVFEEAQNISTIASNTVIREGMLLVEIINNVLEVNNTAGWTELSETDSSSEVLLDNAERLGVLLANSQNNTGSNEPLRISRPNIAITASTFDTSREATIEELTLPKQEDVVNLSLTIQPAQIQIPPNLLLERLSEEGNRSIPVVFIWFQNLEDFLSTSVDNLGNNTRGASSVVSIQVGRARSTTTSAVLLNSPVQLNFSFENINKSQEYRCAFWNFSQSGEGQWSSQNVFTIGNISANLTTTVQCVSTHLTSFAVLVDVAGGLKNIHLDESIGLDVVSYIGCVFSILCLSVTVVFYLYQGKKLFKAVHFFVHLNLSISLLLAYTIFIIGIQTAAASTVGCIFIAAILHYLFLSAFCWMMCEGVMLYLMLVTVFSQVSKAWWFFLLLGYATPLPFVVITISVRWEQYGVRNDDGDLEFCWLSTDNGTIFGFVAPMMLIIVINVLFLILTLRALWKSQKNKLERQLHGNVKDSKIRISIIKSVLFAVVILLPLLGLTWVFGLLTINSNTSVFAWIFTILNSLQGLGVLFFHVIRSDAVWSRIMSTLNNCRGKITTTSDPKLTTDTAKTPKSSWTDSKNVGRQTSQVKLTKNKLLEDVGPIFESKSEEGHLFAVKNAYGVDEAFNPFELEDLMAFEERINLDLDHISFNNEQF